MVCLSLLLCKGSASFLSDQILPKNSFERWGNPKGGLSSSPRQIEVRSWGGMLGIAQASRWGIGQHPGGGSRGEKQRGMSDKSLVIVGGAEG